MTGASLATTLRALREAAGLSQEELAERAGLSSHAISALERGTRTRPYPHTVRALCDALDVDADSRAALIAAVPARGRSTHAPSDSAVPPRTLPMPATSLLGREHDLERAVALVGEHRVVTLTGMGGVGKTRLALAVAVAVQDRFADGVAFVDLAPLRSADEVLPAIADAVDAHATGTAGVTSAIVERLLRPAHPPCRRQRRAPSGGGATDSRSGRGGPRSDGPGDQPCPAADSGRDRGGCRASRRARE